MFMLTAYLDETGHPDDPNSKFVGMAGLIATDKNWKTFENKWKATLNKFNLPYFHMVDFAHSTSIFRSFKRNEVRRRELLSELMQAIRGAYALPFCSMFSMDIIRGYPKYLQKEAGSPYYLAYMGCGVAIADLMSPMRGYGETIATVFAEQSEFQHTAIKIYEVIKDVHPSGDLLESPVFKPMKTFVPLQAADLVAYEAHKEADRRYNRPSESPRWAWKELGEIVKLSAKNINPFMIKRTEIAIKIQMEDAQRRINEAILGKRK